MSEKRSRKKSSTIREEENWIPSHKSILKSVLCRGEKGILLQTFLGQSSSNFYLWTASRFTASSWMRHFFLRDNSNIVAGEFQMRVNVVPNAEVSQLRVRKLESHIWHLSTWRRHFFPTSLRKKVKASGLTFGDSISSRSCNACTNFLVPFICLVFLFRIWTANIQESIVLSLP